ncbi:MAG: hypothetical protein U0K37_08425 [Acutalibacteraceae bacterium]|nr:hypothetical protein [Acutalibacteraceae bacterium]
MKMTGRKLLSVLLLLALIAGVLSACGADSINDKQSVAERNRQSIARRSQAALIDDSHSKSTGKTNQYRVLGIILDASASQFTLQSEGGKAMRFAVNSGTVEKLDMEVGNGCEVTYKTSGNGFIAQEIMSARPKFRNQGAMDSAAAVILCLSGEADISSFAEYCRFPLKVNGKWVRSAQDLEDTYTTDELLSKQLRSAVTATDLFNTVLSGGAFRLGTKDSNVILRFRDQRWRVTEVNF